MAAVEAKRRTPGAPPVSTLVKVMAALTLALGVGLGVGFARRVRRAEPLPILSTLPGFSLTDQRGRSATRATLEGRVWIADFIFTRCVGACPLMTARMNQLRKRVSSDTGFVSFTVDPAHDTPGVLREYARAAGAPDSWLFVTGPQAELYSLSTQGFKLAALEVPPGEAVSGDGPFLHSSRLVLIDRKARVRGTYDSAEEGALGVLVRDLERLRAEDGT